MVETLFWQENRCRRPFAVAECERHMRFGFPEAFIGEESYITNLAEHLMNLITMRLNSVV